MSETVYVVDPVAEERSRVTTALAGESVGVELYDSAEQLLEALCPTASGCVLASSDLPGMGLRALIEEIRRRRLRIAVVVIGREPDLATAVDVVRAGAFDYLERPISDRKLRAAVRLAVGRVT